MQNYLLIGLQAVINPKVCAVGVQCSLSYRDNGVCVEDVGVQCSLLVFPSTSTPLKHIFHQTPLSQSLIQMLKVAGTLQSTRFHKKIPHCKYHT